MPATDSTCVEGHSVLILDRGGRKRLGQLRNVSKVEWHRELTAQSDASVTLSAKSCRDQADFLRSIEPRRHEMAIYRGTERVWEGPIVNTYWYSDRMVMDAHDVTEYLAYTALSQDWPGPDGGGPSFMTQRISQIVEYELQTPYTMTVGTGSATRQVTVPRWEKVDPPANILPYLEVRPSEGAGGILTRSDTTAFQMTVLDHLKDLARGGLDFTVIGRKILVWDNATDLGVIRTLTDADFYGDLEVMEAGSDLVVISHVAAQQQGEPEEANGSAPEEPQASVGHAGGADDYYGPWETVTSMTSEEGSSAPTQDELNSQASRNLVGGNPVPVQLDVPTSSGLRLGVGVGINDLVAGVRVPVRAALNIRPVSQDQRVSTLTVTEDSQGETVQVSLVAAGEAES